MTATETNADDRLSDLADDQHREILAYLHAQGEEHGMPVAPTSEVADYLGVSMRTARRQLLALEGQGVLVRKESGAGWWWYPASL